MNRTDMSLNKLLETVKDRGACVLQSTGSQRLGHNFATKKQKLPGSSPGGSREFEGETALAIRIQ